MMWRALPEFQPRAWLRSSHAQTIAGAYWPLPPMSLSPQSSEITLDDGDRLVVHEDRPESWQETDPTLFLVHGLGGCHRSKYVARMAHRMVQRGWRALRMDMRGFGAGSLTARQHTHAGRWSDIAAVIEATVPASSRLSLVGFSMGANQILKLLGCWPKANAERIDRAIAVAPPLRLWLCAETLNRGFNRIYDWSFVKTLKRQVQRRRAVPGFAAPDRYELPDRLRMFDSLWTAPLCGFQSVDDYYNQASAVHDLKQIQVPTLILAAQDDPIVPAYTFDDLTLSAQVHLAFTKQGGHLGYIGNAQIDGDPFWLDWRLIEQLETPLITTHSNN